MEQFVISSLTQHNVAQVSLFIFPYERWLKPPTLVGDVDFNVLTYARLRGAGFDDFQPSAPECANPPTLVGGS
ncbi:hypothetical protein TCT1_08440 [Xenorhabdus sp. TCT-1]|uniref:Uncharacterized protein n=1 Tax=Xenorhabdus taiwanensis TaxID=3085177 RepID=A0ABN7C1M9_9GAMM|nr:hypothetical protein TCT1_08440 [Xenorhabdus sp. TCT-1]